MTVDEILISAQPGQTRVALRADGRLVAFSLARDDRPRVAGNVYLGRVAKVMPGLKAAFVDLGLDRAGFLNLSDARPPGRAGGGDRIQDYVGEGDAVLVQVLRDPEDDKGAKLTTRISLPGRCLVLLPGDPGIRLSQKITDKAVRAGLEARVAGLAGEDAGLLVRTRAAGADASQLATEAEALRADWMRLRDAAAAATPPARLLPAPGPAVAALRDADPAVRRIAVDDPATLSRLRDEADLLAPALLDRLQAVPAGSDLFAEEGVDAALEEALAPRVGLPGGGSLIIEQTAALTAVDVNAGDGRGGALAINLAAAAEIARQVRLRNLSGLLAVDFLKLKREAERQRVLAALREAVADDPAGVHVGRFTPFGLVELTRRKRGESLARLMTADCPACDGAGRVDSPATTAYAILRAVEREGRVRPGRALAVRARPEVVGALNGLAAGALAATEDRLARPLALEPDTALAPGSYEIRPVTKEDR